MHETALTCRDERRRHATRARRFNGIDFIEVDESQTRLCVHLFGETPANISPANVRISGGRRVRDIEVLAVYAEKEEDESLGECLRVVVNKAGDFSTYTLEIYDFSRDAEGNVVKTPLAGFDPRYASAEFTFKINCPTELDCKSSLPCAQETPAAPDINYLAKDYASFRQLILDRLAVLLPDWRERQPPDIGIALVEVLAYVGDYLSYYQDAVATEAYLDTARLRVSVRRHARLIDYRMHEGANARAWLCVETDRDRALRATEVFFITGAAELSQLDGQVISEEQLEKLRLAPAAYEVFEPLLAGAEPDNELIRLYKAHNRIRFYTWGDAECCLPKGATRATLVGELRQPPKPDATPDAARTPVLYLQVGDVLIFEEVKGAKTGEAADADPAQRHAVRLTGVAANVDPLFERAVVEIEWSEDDALPFALCLSAQLAAPECRLVEEISVARGNVILVDHGRTQPPEDLGEVPVKTTVGDCDCGAAELTHLPDRFYPHLAHAPLTFSQPLAAAAAEKTSIRTSWKTSWQAPPRSASVAAAPVAASKLLVQDPRHALPQIKSLVGRPRGVEASDAVKDEWRWQAKSDLLGSLATDRHFVVEMDNDGRAHLRFGDGELGRRPDATSRFLAVYRVGNGAAGNVGAETITQMVLRRGAISGARIRPRNPLPAVGGSPAEPLANVKMFAPGAIRQDLQRAVTAKDYATLAERQAQVQRAAAELRWTGSWYEAQVAVDARGKTDFDDSLSRAIKTALYAYRRIGHDLRVVAARYVPLDVELLVCVLPQYQRAHVEAALREVFSNRLLADGKRGFFHPDNLTFGDGVYLSRLVAAAQSVTGVESVAVKRLARQFEDSFEDKGEAQSVLEEGLLRLGAMEVARLDNDADFPEHGRLTLRLHGGR